ncbi:MAG: GNAT family N-acetyltransferase [Ferruginibacter sp.]
MLQLYFDPFPDLMTERLELRQLSVADAVEIFELRSDEEVNKYVGRQPAKVIDDALEFIDKINNGVTDRQCMYWAICLKDVTPLIGTICIWNIDEETQSAEIGYELIPVYQGKGLMQESIEKVIRFGFEAMHLKMITAFPHSEHTKSIRLLEKNNFCRDQKAEQAMLPDIGPCVLYTLSRPQI